MPQPVMIQTEPMAAVSAKKNAGAGESTDKSAFSSELNQQIEQGRAASSRSQSDKDQAAKAADKEQNVAADGNKLPAEESSKPVSDSEQTQSESDAEQQADKNETNAEKQDAADATSESEDQDGVVVAAGQTTDSSKKNEAGAGQTDKKVQTQVNPSQQGSDNTKTAPKQSEGQSAESATSAKNTEQTAAKTISETINKLTGEEKQQAQKATPNLAAVLKQVSEDKADPPKIRADIMDALQRQQNKQEVTTNLRNLIAAQAQQADSKTAVTLPPLAADRAAPESTASTLTPTSLSGLLSSPGGSSAATVSQPVLSLPVQPNMQNPAWAQVMSSRVVYMAKEGVQQAELRMNPANLGPVEVRLNVQNDQASVTFLAQQGTTREALEQALPRLRESFAESGLQLAHAEVGEHQHQQQEQSEQAGDSHIFAQAGGQGDDIENETAETVSSEGGSVGLSLYA
ncbi:flagellar hook-length control protein FliK [Methylophaga sp. OBS1]|uniref:flagellar hook-length control protein FliK n=1 Tax=Methylophaga sp. OBS1 TaxID=2991933 RepID=UPI002254272D|nr:flagellar hook-length control protein FliK [Methylophaga sp. OBS1]MCX4193876.1 flagellar hook-length control protein FliK [Methylophaga sp. OBS1]